MGARPWYKRYPSDFINGCITGKLNAEEIGVYAIVIDLLYDRGPVDNDPRWLGGMMQISTRKCRTIIEALLKKKKLLLIDEKLSNPRVVRQRLGEEKEHEKLSNSGVKGAQKTNENRSVSNNPKDLAEKGPSETGRQARSQKLDAKEKERKGGANAQTEYSFVGKIVRLNAEDFDTWRKRFPKEKERKGGANAQTEYSFVGKIVRLNAEDFDTWRKRFPDVPDFIAELTAADAYYADNPPNNGKWFFPVSNWLKRAQVDAIQGRRPKRKVGEAYITPGSKVGS